MDHPERPSRHRNHDKWKRIIEPAGDSDSSEWSSDSDVGMSGSTLHYRNLDTSLGSGSSANGSRDQQTALNASLSSSSQNKSPTEALLGFAFESTLQGSKPSTSGQSISTGWAADFQALTAKLRIGSDAGAGTSGSYSHLMHHDYAERDVNNDRGNNDYSFSHSFPRDPRLAWKRKRKWMLCNRSEMSSADCTNNVGAPSTSSLGMAVDETPIPEPENAINIIETPADEDRWRILSNNRNLMSSPTRRRFFDPAGEPTDVGEVGIPVPGCSTSVVLATSIQTQTQTQAQSQVGLNDSGSTEIPDHPASPCPFFTADWYLQQRSKKQVRFRDQIYLHEPGDASSVPEDYSHPVRRTEPEIQVLSMAGPSNSSSRIVYSNGTRHSRSQPEEAPTPEEVQTTPPAVPAEPDEEGVEVIMVDDAPSETSGGDRTHQAKPTSAQDQQEQLQQQSDTSQQQSDSSQQQPKEEENIGPTSSKQVRLDGEVLNQGLIGLLECPVCLEYMGPPIHQCRRGHLVCLVCKPKLPSCPTCRSRFTESRNLAMEKVADKLHYPCKNAHVGCTITLRLRNKDEHEANCIFRSYRCIVVPPCEWKGQHGEILPHVRQMHANTLLQGSEHVLEMRLGDFTEQSSQNWIVSTLGELFRVNLGAVRGGRVQVFGCVLLLGPAQRAPLFRYTLTVGPAEGDKALRKMTYSRTTHCYVERCSVYYSAGDSFHLRTESAQLFSTGPQNDRVMCVKLCIEKAER